jgi:hypothetical protein
MSISSRGNVTFNVYVLQLPNLCAMEINEIKPFFARAMGVLTQLKPLGVMDGAS